MAPHVRDKRSPRIMSRAQPERQCSPRLPPGPTRGVVCWIFGAASLAWNGVQSCEEEMKAIA